MFRTQETLESGKKRIDETVASLDDIGVRPPGILFQQQAPAAVQAAPCLVLDCQHDLLLIVRHFEQLVTAVRPAPAAAARPQPGVEHGPAGGVRAGQPAHQRRHHRALGGSAHGALAAPSPDVQDTLHFLACHIRLLCCRLVCVHPAWVARAMLIVLEGDLSAVYPALLLLFLTAFVAMYCRRAGAPTRGRTSPIATTRSG